MDICALQILFIIIIIMARADSFSMFRKDLALELYFITKMPTTEELYGLCPLDPGFVSEGPTAGRVRATD